MARICFTWELGQGYGHLVRYRSLIERLLGCGHDILFLVKDAARASNVFNNMAVTIVAITPGATPPERMLPQLNSYPEILFNVGFFDADHLSAQLAQWIEHFDQFKPDVLVIDHSPSALLASRFFTSATVSSGSGFTVPPRTTPMRPFRYWSMRQREHLPTREDHVLQVCNAVLARGGVKPLSALCELLATDCEWLLTFPELDHYGEREEFPYLGAVPGSDFGETPQWPDHPGPKLFAYLSTTTLPDALTSAIERADASVCIFAPDLLPGEIAKLPAQRVWQAEKPVDLAQIAQHARAVVTNGGLNTVSACLCAGLPQLALPNNMERHMVGRRLELMGGGLMAALARPNNLAAKLRAVLTDRTYGRAAAQFARRHADVTSTQQTDSMLSEIERLLGRRTVGLRD